MFTPNKKEVAKPMRIPFPRFSRDRHTTTCLTWCHCASNQSQQFCSGQQYLQNDRS